MLTPCTQLKVVSQTPLFLCYLLLYHTLLLPPFRYAWLSLLNQCGSHPCHLFSNWCIFLGPSSATLTPMLGHWTSISASHPAHSLPSHHLSQTCFFVYFTQLSLLRVWPSLNLQILLDAFPLQFIILTLHWPPSLPGSHRLSCMLSTRTFNPYSKRTLFLCWAPSLSNCSCFSPPLSFPSILWNIFKENSV